jgi:hypothetical protein
LRFGSLIEDDLFGKPLHTFPDHAPDFARLKGNSMGNAGKKNEPPKKADDKAKKPPPPPSTDDDDFEDGDMATPKRDRYGNDDEPL